MTRRRVLIVQPSFQPPGGGHGVAAWMLEALRGCHHVGVLTWEPLDLDAMNRFYGTSVQKADVTIEPLARWIRTAFDLVPSPIASLKYSLLLQAAAKIAGRYDLCVSVNNEADFRRPGVQYIHYPYYQRPRPGTDLRWFHGLPALLARLLLVGRPAGGFLGSPNEAEPDADQLRLDGSHGAALARHPVTNALSSCSGSLPERAVGRKTPGVSLHRTIRSREGARPGDRHRGPREARGS